MNERITLLRSLAIRFRSLSPTVQAEVMKALIEGAIDALEAVASDAELERAHEREVEVEYARRGLDRWGRPIDREPIGVVPPAPDTSSAPATG